ncbi:MAG TPA: zf-TFIIB domain-containing protein [Bacteroidales bacterium]|nr:zf-TFIIB domain-containing protein [Bacteroidales bacterium]
MNCPRCTVELKNKTILDFKYFLNIDYCESCGGIWLDKGEMERLEKTIEPTFYEIRKIPSQKVQLQPVICPSCSNTEPLQKLQHWRDNHVIIDLCTQCKGIWLDTGEIEAIREENWVFVIGKFFKWLVSEEV